MPRLIAFVFSYDEFIAIDFDGLGRCRVSWLVGLWNQLAIDSTINLDCVYLSSLVASAIRRSQVRTISHL